jgi:hypothetical protein
MAGKLTTLLTLAVGVGCTEPTAILNPTVQDLVGTWELVDQVYVNDAYPTETHDLRAGLPVCDPPSAYSTTLCIIKPFLWRITPDGLVVSYTQVQDSLIQLEPPIQLQVQGDSLILSGVAIGHPLSVRLELYGRRMVLYSSVQLHLGLVADFGWTVVPGATMQDATYRREWRRRAPLGARLTGA